MVPHRHKFNSYWRDWIRIQMSLLCGEKVISPNNVIGHCLLYVTVKWLLQACQRGIASTFTFRYYSYNLCLHAVYSSLTGWVWLGFSWLECISVSTHVTPMCRSSDRSFQKLCFLIQPLKAASQFIHQRIVLSLLALLLFNTLEQIGAVEAVHKTRFFENLWVAEKHRHLSYVILLLY